MSNHALGALPALALMGLALAFPGPASADVLVGCKNKTNGNVRVVADAAHVSRQRDCDLVERHG
jgi:hypothetical protein